MANKAPKISQYQRAHFRPSRTEFPIISPKIRTIKKNTPYPSLGPNKSIATHKAGTLSPPQTNTFSFRFPRRSCCSDAAMATHLKCLYRPPVIAYQQKRLAAELQPAKTLGIAGRVEATLRHTQRAETALPISQQAKPFACIVANRLYFGAEVVASADQIQLAIFVEVLNDDIVDGRDLRFIRQFV